MEKSAILSIVAAVVVAVVVSGALSAALTGGAGAASGAAQKAAADAASKASAADAKAGAVEAKVSKLAPPPAKRSFPITAIEIKGSTNTDSLAAPPQDPKTISDAYGYKGPGVADKADPKKWEVSNYIFGGSPMVAYVGDTVEMPIFGVNGDKHVIHVEDPDGIELKPTNQTLNRGREITVTFTADKPGLYTLVCTTHDPTMKTAIVVLPRP